MSIAGNDIEVISLARDWLAQGHQINLVTVANTWGSSPRPIGSMAVVRDDGALAGSVSGGCVEKQLHEEFLHQGRGRIVQHRIDDEQARRFGLSCGGHLELVFESLQTAGALDELHAALTRRQRVRRHLDLHTGDVTLELLTDSPAASSAEPPTESPAENPDPSDNPGPAATAGTTTAAAELHYDGQSLSKTFGPGWRLLLIGAGQLSRYTAEFALALDYEVLVCEPREHFRHAWSVEHAVLIDSLPDDAVLQHATDAHSAVLALTHDPNLDDMALMEALPSKAFYVGALGSRANYQKRCQRLLAVGLEPPQIDRLHGPVGIDIGSRSSAEIAVSIIAHLIQVRRQRPVPASRDSSSPTPATTS